MKNASKKAERVSNLCVMQTNENNMIKTISGILFIFSFFILSSCFEKVSVDEKKERIEASGERIIRIVFELHGDDIGSPEYQAILHKIITSIKGSEAGEILSSGFGMGNMEIVIKVKGEDAVKKIEKIINENYPEANYSIKR